MDKDITKDKHGAFDFRKALKTTPTHGINKLKYIDLYLNRPMAALIVRAVYHTSITPNGLTYFSFLLGLLGAFFFTRGDHTFFILGGILLQLSSVVDGADGMLARAKNISSEYGAHLDLFFDRIIDFATYVGVAMGAGVRFNNPNLLFLGMLAAGLYLLQVNLFYITKSYLKITKTGDAGEFRAILIWAVVIFAFFDRFDIYLYLLLAQTVIANLYHLFNFIRLGRKK